MSDSPAASSGAEPKGLAPRRVAWQVLQAVAAGAYADGALERELGRTPLTPADRGLATELAYGAIRQRRLLDAWLDQLGKVPAERQPPKLRWLLHIGLYQLLASDRVPPSAAVSTTVELAKRGGLARLAPVANGLLRAFLRRREAGDRLPLTPAQSADLAVSLGVRHSLPDWLSRELLQWLPPERAEAFGRACNSTPSLDLRVNRLHSSHAAVQAALADAGVEAIAIEGLPSGLTLKGRTGDLSRLPGFAEGHWCVQDRAAQRIAPLLDPQPGERILDACAAPGGKSTHLAELMGDQGLVLALDRGEARLRRVSRNAERLGLQSIAVQHGDATALAQKQPELLASFDRILVDAPCSGLGTLARHADARWRIDPAAIDELVALQRQLLDGLLPLLKPQGHLVYATCTVHPRENNQLIEAVLADHPELQLRQSWQLWPGEVAGAGDGFYAALLERQG
ncbi:MAG: 16S rRNA (cytosine(967)-C(5))-methyltransferase [Vulcanococcus sp.]|uniref:16S rRNA (cytosine(967)-C(5))-methyltransferase n=1 Tax=Vulcanococcus sp. TaxID=2856995 RepID=UPI0025E08FBB|nr:16S rRNA (cytosine(967)-C(5))-methyltransferase [Vulcanococcus sp.]MBW0181931.1 16S rRNA (cytosine(967)-C(5))-methyltransferase [Vulcanococcus sp.]